MRIDLAPILSEADELIAAIEVKSWHCSVNAAHACLRAMPSPAWAEATPGLAQFGPGEWEANQAVNLLRRLVMAALMAFTDERRSWEASDEWPKPTGLRAATDRLRSICSGVVIVEVQEEASA